MPQTVNCSLLCFQVLPLCSTSALLSSKRAILNWSSVPFYRFCTWSWELIYRLIFCFFFLGLRRLRWQELSVFKFSRSHYFVIIIIIIHAFIFLFFIFVSYNSLGFLHLALATLEITCYSKRFSSRVLK